MTFTLNTAAITRIAGLPAVREAALAGARLVALWPLTDATRLDNDEKYAEDLQVRLTRAFAQVMTGREDVTMPDAEFVYEGAESIPGRPQEIVDALLAANDACDAMADFGETGEAGLAEDAARALGVSWGSGAEAAVREVLEAAGTITADAGSAGDAPIGGSTDAAADAGTGTAAAPTADSTAAAKGSAAGAADDAAEPAAADIEIFAVRFAAALVMCDALLAACADPAHTPDGAEQAGRADRAGESEDAAARAALPVILMVNELREQLGVPRIFLAATAIRGLMAARHAAASDAAARLDVTVTTVAPLAGAEWAKHRDAVLWDPDEAKRRAREEDEAKSKAALAAKFAHVKDDPSKPQVEL